MAGGRHKKRSYQNLKYGTAEGTVARGDDPRFLFQRVGPSGSSITLPIAESDVTNLVSDLAAKVPTSRTISTTAPVTGGGDLSANRTFAVSAATTSATGIVELATDGETASNVAVQGSDGRLAMGALGAWWFGSGLDGDLSLTGNVTLDDGDYVRHYNNLDLQGFSITHHSSDRYMVIFVKGTLTMNGGTIKNNYAHDPVSTGGSGTNGAGPGGTGAQSYGAVFVFARTISGSGTITVAGDAGTAGTNGVASAGSSNGGGSDGGGASARCFGTQITLGGTGSAGGGLGGDAHPSAGGAGATAGAGYSLAGGEDLSQSIRDYTFALFTQSGLFQPGTGNRWFGALGGSGGGGGGASQLGTNKAGAGGGGGAGAAGFAYRLQAGKAGGNGGATFVPGAGDGTGGGGGGGGAGGSMLVVVTGSAGAGLTITAAGGAGGVGGNGYNQGGGGGGGSGGAGGVVYYIGPSGPTVTAAGGALGAGGTSGGNAGSSGLTGNAGIAMNILI